MSAPELYVTNFNPNFTGVSATAAGVVAGQSGLDLRLVGQSLPGCPGPISKRAALALCRNKPPGRPFAIWHVRRNTEMRAALWARDVLRRPIRIVFTSAAQRRHSALPRWLISRMDAVIATTEEAARFVPHVRAVVPHGVDTDKFQPSPARSPGLHVATIGRIRPEKGTDLFVDAMLRLMPDCPEMTASVIGKAARSDQAFLEGLKARVAEAGLSDRFDFPGEVPADQMPEFMRGLSLLVALPRYEGYGMTPLEAMASGVPFVASDTGHFQSFSATGLAGRVVALEDVDQAVSEIRTLLSDPSRHAQMAQVARKTVVEHHSITGEVNGIRAVYDALWEAG